MEKDIAAITQKLDRLRCDLSATWTALAAMQAALPAEQRAQVLQAMARISAQKQNELYDAPVPNQQLQSKLLRALQQMQEAEQRVYTLLSAQPTTGQMPQSR